MIAIGCDHAGFELKQEIIRYLENKKYFKDNYKDFGCYNLDSVDYPDVAANVCEFMLEEDFPPRGILICGTGIGMSIVANKYPGIRAANCTSVYMAKMSIVHNMCNVITLGSRIVTKELAFEMLDIWSAAPFPMGNKHTDRIDKIRILEDINFK